MLADIRACKQLGAHGVVVGCLRPDGSVDTASTQQLVQEARSQVRPRPAPMHTKVTRQFVAQRGLVVAAHAHMPQPAVHNIAHGAGLQDLDVTFHRAFDVSRDLR